MGLFAVNRACKSLDLLTKHKTPQYDEVDLEGKVDHVAQLKKFQALSHRADLDWFTPKGHCVKLRSKVVPLSYRLGASRGGKDKLTDPSAELIDCLILRAESWKKRQQAFKQDPGLTEEDIKKIVDIASYPDYLPFVNWDKFFKWSILCSQSVDTFVQFPHITEKLSTCLLRNRIGSSGGLEFIDDNGAKDVTLLVEDNPVSLLDGNKKITTETGYSFTLDQMFKSYRKKNVKEGHFTYFKDRGSVAWDPNKMGHVDRFGKVTPIDITVPDWYNQLPMMEEALTPEEATSRFDLPCDGDNWVLTMVCKRSSNQMDTYGSHSFLRIAIPIEDATGNKTYKYTEGIGKFTKDYPQNSFDALTFLFCPKRATFQCPDNNKDYIDRESLELHFSMTPENGVACLESFRKDFENAQKNNVIFQILRKNCSDWSVKKIRKYVGIEESQVMDISYLDLKPKGFLGTLLKVLRKAPKVIRSSVLNTLAFFMGGFTGMTTVKPDGTKKTFRLLNSPPWKKNRPFHHPGSVFSRIS